MTMVAYRHPAAGFTLTLPDGWAVMEELQGVAMVAVAPRYGDRFQANIVVTMERMVTGMALEAWATAAIGQLPDHLVYYQLIDREWTGIAGRSAYRILAHHAVEGRIAVTMEQWLLVESGIGYAITGTAGTPEYGSLAALFAAVAGGFKPGPGLVA